jgi:hypothetical protein
MHVVLLACVCVARLLLRWLWRDGLQVSLTVQSMVDRAATRYVLVAWQLLCAAAQCMQLNAFEITWAQRIPELRSLATCWTLSSVLGEGMRGYGAELGGASDAVVRPRGLDVLAWQRSNMPLPALV